MSRRPYERSAAPPPEEPPSGRWLVAVAAAGVIIVAAVGLGSGHRAALSPLLQRLFYWPPLPSWLKP